MPPLRRVSNCSPSASARTVTAHSLNAIGMDFEGGVREGLAKCNPRAGTEKNGPARGTSSSFHGIPEFQNTLSKTDVRSQTLAGEPLEDVEHGGEIGGAEVAAHRRAEDLP